MPTIDLKGDFTLFPGALAQVKTSGISTVSEIGMVLSNLFSGHERLVIGIFAGDFDAASRTGTIDEVGFASALFATEEIDVEINLTGFSVDYGQVFSFGQTLIPYHEDKWLPLAATGDMIVLGSNESDNILKPAGAFSFAGDDTMTGGARNDEFHGGDGNDIMNAGAGDDTFYGGDGNDRIRGGSGNDRLFGYNGRDTLVGETGRDQLFGEAGRDKVRGGAGDDIINGGDGNDKLKGGADKDLLRGGSGNDLLNGQSGNDRLVGGSGRDKFVFKAKGRDTVTDFEDGTDRIQIGGADAFQDLTIRDAGRGALIIHDDIRVLLVGIDADDLGARDFIF